MFLKNQLYSNKVIIKLKVDIKEVILFYGDVDNEKLKK